MQFQTLAFEHLDSSITVKQSAPSAPQGNTPAMATPGVPTVTSLQVEDSLISDMVTHQLVVQQAQLSSHTTAVAVLKGVDQQLGSASLTFMSQH